MSQNSPLRYPIDPGFLRALKRAEEGCKSEGDDEAPTTMPIIRRSVPIQQAIGGRAVKTGGVRRENTLASSPILSIVSVACILAHGVRRSDIVEADLELPGKTSVTTIGMAYVANTVANLSQTEACDADIVLNAEDTISWPTTLDAIRSMRHYDVVVWLSSREAISGLANAIAVLTGSPHWIMVLPGKASVAIKTSGIPGDISSEELVKTINGVALLDDNIVKWGAPS